MSGSACFCCEFVICNDIGPLLSIIQVFDPNDWNRLPAEALDRLYSPVAGEYLAGFIDQDRNRKSQVLDGFLNLLDLAW